MPMIRIQCFMISQNPEIKTDYYHVIPVEADTNRRALGTLLWRIHQAVAANPTPEVILGFPVSSPSASWCLCRCRQVQSQSGRTIVRLQAIVVATGEATESWAINPLIFYFAEQLWSAMAHQHLACIEVDTNDVQVGGTNARLSEELYQLLRLPETATRIVDITPETLTTALYHVIERFSPSERMQVSFAIGLPTQTQLPVELHPSIILRQRVAPPHSMTDMPKKQLAGHGVLAQRITASHTRLMNVLTQLEQSMDRLGSNIDEQKTQQLVRQYTRMSAHHSTMLHHTARVSTGIEN
jgi:hypothetical protein